MTAERPPKKSDTLEVRIPYAAKRAFQDACRREGRTASEVVRDFIEGYVRRAEAATERGGETPKAARSLAMTLMTRNGRRALLAGAVGTLGLVAFAVSPSAAEVDFRQMFDGIDTNADGVVTLDEFAAPRQGRRGDVMIMRSQRVETADDGATSEQGEEFWIPASPPLEAPSSMGLEVRRVMRDGEIETENVERFGAGDPMVIGLQTREFEQSDEDGDGGVDFAEFEARHRAMMEATFRRLDGNGDGRLAKSELDAFPVVFGLPDAPQAPPNPFSADVFAALDRDGDGSVSLEEFASGPAAP